MPARVLASGKRPSPATRTKPEIFPPWNCGTSPLNTRSSVDLPPAEGPANSMNAPAGTSSVTSCNAAPDDDG